MTTITFITSILFGFGIYSIFLIVLKPWVANPLKTTIEKFDNSACVMIAIAGLVYLFVWLFIQLIQYNRGEEVGIYHFIGPYWMRVWLQPILFLSSQLLWFKKLRNIALIRFSIALALMLSIERMVVYLTSLHRDYLPSQWSTPFENNILEWLGDLGIFGVVSIGFHLIRITWNNKKK